jgi:hypothetical protein
MTREIRLGTLVTEITYRNLAHLAKIVATRRRCASRTSRPRA